MRTTSLQESYGRPSKLEVKNMKSGRGASLIWRFNNWSNESKYLYRFLSKGELSSILASRSGHSDAGRFFCSTRKRQRLNQKSPHTCSWVTRPLTAISITSL